MDDPAVEALLRGRPPAAALRWVADAVGARARITSMRRLRGGSSTAMHAITVADTRGRRHRLVLRRFVRADWLAMEPDLAEREARVLRLLEGTGVLAPRFVAVDEVGAACDVPALLMTRLPGRVQFAPGDMTSWLRQMAAALPAIHAVDAGTRLEVQPYQPYNEPRGLAPPPWSSRPEAWERAIELSAGPAPATPRCFIHRDYHPGNVLWSRGRLTGVLDWVNASWGPPAIDVGHCRRNLASLHGVGVADRFLSICLSVAGETLGYHPYWDAMAAIDCLPEPGVFRGWYEHGVRGLSPELVRSRLDDYIASVVARV